VWSISVSIALVEALVPDRATTPWLRGIGLTVTTILFVLAAIATTSHQIKTSHFVASTAQFCGAALVCVAAIVAAFLLPTRSASRKPGSVPNPWLIAAAALVAGSIFLIVPGTWGWTAVAIYSLLDLMMIASMSTLSHRDGWNATHRWHSLAEPRWLTPGMHSFRIPRSATPDAALASAMSFSRQP
jgi:hypothetical protein